MAADLTVLDAGGDRATAVLQRAGAAAAFAADEFFAARLANPHTRRAYARAVGRFLAWVDEQDVELAQVTPGMAGRFLEELAGGAASKNQVLAACRQFCAGLVQRHAMLLNPFATVAGRKHQVVDGRTPEMSIAQAHALLAAIDSSTLVGLRDRALFGTLIYTGARVGAVVRLKRGDLQDRALRILEKGGKDRTIPVREDLEGWLAAYIEAVGAAAAAAPLFQGVIGATGSRPRSTGRPRTAAAVREQLKRRLRVAGLPERLRPHSFRVLVVTDLLAQRVPLEDVQYLVGTATRGPRRSTTGGAGASPATSSSASPSDFAPAQPKGTADQKNQGRRTAPLVLPLWLTVKPRDFRQFRSYISRWHLHLLPASGEV